MVFLPGKLHKTTLLISTKTFFGSNELNRFSFPSNLFLLFIVFPQPVFTQASEEGRNQLSRMLTGMPQWKKEKETQLSSVEPKKVLELAYGLIASQGSRFINK